MQQQYTLEDIENMTPPFLLQLALDDLERIEEDDRYVVDTRNVYSGSRKGWNKYFPDYKCHVSLAGSVLTRFLEPCDSLFSQRGCGITNFNWIYGLESFSEGNIPNGLNSLGYKCSGFSKLEIADYNKDPKKYKKQLRYLVEMLDEHHLTPLSKDNFTKKNIWFCTLVPHSLLTQWLVIAVTVS